jgi:hypothetical protein
MSSRTFEVAVAVSAVTGTPGKCFCGGEGGGVRPVLWGAAVVREALNRRALPHSCLAFVALQPALA